MKPHVPFPLFIAIGLILAAGCVDTTNKNSINSSSDTTGSRLNETPTISSPLKRLLVVSATGFSCPANLSAFFDNETVGTVNPTSPLHVMVSEGNISDTHYCSNYGVTGDGTDETTELQNCLDAASSGDIVSLPTGLPTILTGQPVDIPAGIELAGNGATLKLKDDADLSQYHGYYTGNYYVGSDTWIHHVVFDGNMANQNVPDYCGAGRNYRWDTDYYFPRCPNVGIVMPYADNVLFEYNEVKNYGGYSLEVYYGDDVIIQHNIVHDGWQYGIILAGKSSDYVDNALIEHNFIYDMGQCGVKTVYATNSIINGNTIHVPGLYDLFTLDHTPYGSPAPTGVRLYSADGPNDHITISNNYISGNGGDNDEIAIQSDNTDNSYITITNNTVYDVDLGMNLPLGTTAYVVGNGVYNANTCYYDGMVDPHTFSDNACEESTPTPTPSSTPAMIPTTVPTTLPTPTKKGELY
jgi:hypothetical protein